MLVSHRFTPDDEGPRISVVQYFRQKYNIVLRYANWPSLQAGSDTKPIYLPMEVLCSLFAIVCCKKMLLLMTLIMKDFFFNCRSARLLRANDIQRN